MNAYEIPNLRFSFPAGGAVAIRRFVTIGTGSVGKQATANAVVVGVSMNAVEVTSGLTAEQQVLEVADGILMVDAGGTVAEGDLVASDANGKAVKVTTETNIAGKAITAGTAGSLIAVKVY